MATARLDALLLEQNTTKLPLTTCSEIPSLSQLLRMSPNLREIRQIHAQLVVSGLVNRPPNPARLLESYVSASQLNEALKIFQLIPSPDPFVYNIMIRGLILGKRPSEAFVLFHKLLSQGVKPDNHTYTFVLKACSHLKALSEGEQVHCQIIKTGVKPNSFIHSSLITMYSNANHVESAEQILAELPEVDVVATNAIITGYLTQGLVENARKLFDIMSTKDDATWSIMVTGYTKNGMYAEALVIFEAMMALQIPISEATLVSALSACSHIGNLNQGIYIHRYIEKDVHRISTKLWTALVDMYAKCGEVAKAISVFDEIRVKETSTWNALINGLAVNGCAKEALEVFSVMRKTFQPNEITMLGVLSACNHGGLVEEGKKWFRAMEEFGLTPKIEHYGCMVDLLGRAGCLEEAERLIECMPYEANGIILSSFLFACGYAKDISRAERVVNKVISMEPQNDGNYIMLRNLYATEKRWQNVEEIKGLMKRKGAKKEVGCSIIEIDSMVWEFVAGDKVHPQWEAIHLALDNLSMNMRGPVTYSRQRFTLNEG